MAPGPICISHNCQEEETAKGEEERTTAHVHGILRTQKNNFFFQLELMILVTRDWLAS